MTAQIKKLKNEPDEFFVKYTEDLMERIKSGETTGIVAVEQTRNGYTYYTCGGIEDRWKTIGFLSRMIYKLHDEA